MSPLSSPTHCKGRNFTHFFSGATDPAVVYSESADQNVRARGGSNWRFPVNLAAFAIPSFLEFRDLDGPLGARGGSEVSRVLTRNGTFALSAHSGVRTWSVRVEIPADNLASGAQLPQPAIPSYQETPRRKI